MTFFNPVWVLKHSLAALLVGEHRIMHLSLCVDVTSLLALEGRTDRAFHLILFCVHEIRDVCVHVAAPVFSDCFQFQIPVPLLKLYVALKMWLC